jgi:hypothetical protein
MIEVNPYLISDEAASGRALSPLPKRDKAFQEDWLQELLFKHPMILPIGYIDDSYAPLVPLGKEISGIDDLYVSPSGHVTIVETKLWRNAEAHRTVVAQILEYAKTIAAWNYGKLDEAVKSYMSKRFGEPISIFGAVKKAVHNFDLDEIEFESKVQDCLTNGRFALVVVGDRIFPEATQLAETIQAAPHMQYTMGFVELRCYRIERSTNWPLIVFPQFVAKTKEVTRAVVRVIYEEKKPDVQIEAVEDGDKMPHKRTNLSLFVAGLPSGVRDIVKAYLQRWMTAGYTISWGKVGFSMRILWKGKPTTLFEAYPTTLTILPEKWARQYDLPADVYKRYKDKLMRSLAVGSLVAAGRKYPEYRNLSEEDVALILDSTDKLANELIEAEKK